jgi:hypothetical protein
MERTNEEITEIRAEIAERYNMVFPDVVLEPLWWGRRPVNKAEGRFAIVDQNTDTVFNVCTELYQPVYHEMVIKNVEEAAALCPEYGAPKISVKLMADGGKMKVNVEFPEVDIEIKKGDILHPNSDVRTSYDLGWKYAMDFGAYRLVCSNGLKVGEVFESFKKRHLTSLGPNILSDSLKGGMSRFSDQKEIWSRWAEDKILPDLYTDMWEALPFSQPEKEKIETMKLAGSGLYLPEALKSGELTVWEAYNAMTQYASHEIKSELRVVEIGPQITRVFERLARS